VVVHIHLCKFGKGGPTNLEADGGLEDDEEDEREDGVVPVLVQAPEQDAQHLKDEEGRDRVLLLFFKSTLVS
jgi:hypothetical protein